MTAESVKRFRRPSRSRFEHCERVRAAEPHTLPPDALTLRVSLALRAGSGAGKILGPVALGLIAGAHNLVSPKATEHAVLPAFLFLGACCVATGLAYQVLGIETHGRPLEE